MIDEVFQVLESELVKFGFHIVKREGRLDLPLHYQELELKDIDLTTALLNVWCFEIEGAWHAFKSQWSRFSKCPFDIKSKRRRKAICNSIWHQPVEVEWKIPSCFDCQEKLHKELKEK